VIVAMAIFARRYNKHVIDVTDFAAPFVPIGLGAGRIGNFINGELWGKPTDVPWAMVFPKDVLQLARHPSQLYQFALEGVALFCILWLFSKKSKPRWCVSGLFLLCYGVFRILSEFVREPDPQIGYLAFGWVTEGQVLSLPMVIIGIMLIVFGFKMKKFPQS
jgi:phosphatidylglycerol:prolipoprotein diacylglycerol transferase